MLCIDCPAQQNYGTIACGILGLINMAIKLLRNRI